MLPAGDHSSRSIVHRRVASWASWSDRGTTGLTNGEEENGSSFEATTSEELSRSLLLPQLEYEDEEDDLLSVLSESLRKVNWKLLVVFLVLIVSGVSNVVLAKLQALPM